MILIGHRPLAPPHTLPSQQMHVTSAAMAAYFFFLPPHIAVTLLIATLFVYYTVTSLGGAPEVSGELDVYTGRKECRPENSLDVFYSRVS